MHSRNSCKTLKCPRCNWHYKYQETLEIHMKEKHPDTELNCLYCLTNQSHPRLARGETYTCGYKPYRCEVCNYSTTTKGNLSIHMTSDKHMTNIQHYDPNNTATTTSPASPSASSSPTTSGQSLTSSQQLQASNQSPASTGSVSGAGATSAINTTVPTSQSNIASATSQHQQQPLSLVSSPIASAAAAAAAAAAALQNTAGINIKQEPQQQQQQQQQQQPDNQQQQQDAAATVAAALLLAQQNPNALEDYINSQEIAKDSYDDPSRKYKCHRCKVAFTRQSYLTAHNKTLFHRKGEKLAYPMEKYLDPNRPFKCDICKESFTQKSILLVHNNSVSHLNKLRQTKRAAGQDLILPQLQQQSPPLQEQSNSQAQQMQAAAIHHQQSPQPTNHEHPPSTAIQAQANQQLQHHQQQQNALAAALAAGGDPMTALMMSSAAAANPMAALMAGGGMPHPMMPFMMNPQLMAAAALAAAQTSRMLDPMSQSLFGQATGVGASQTNKTFADFQAQQQQLMQQAASQLIAAASSTASSSAAGPNVSNYNSLSSLLNPATAEQLLQQSVAAAAAASSQPPTSVVNSGLIGSNHGSLGVQDIVNRANNAVSDANLVSSTLDSLHNRQQQQHHHHHQQQNSTNGLESAQAAAAAAAAAAVALSVQQKRARTRISEEQLRILRQYFDINNSPTEEQLQEMSVKSELPLKVIKHWFRNTLFKERQKNKDSPYNFNNPPMLALNLEEYERTGEAKVTPISDLVSNASQAISNIIQQNSNQNTDVVNDSNNCSNAPESTTNNSINGSQQPLTINTTRPPSVGSKSSDDNVEASAKAVVQAVVSAVSELSPHADENGIGPSSTWSPLQCSGGELFDQTWALVNSSKMSDSSCHSINSSTNSKSKRANRTRFSDRQVKVLQEFFETNAYPKDDDLECLSRKLGLSARVIVVWFQNARQKARKVYENRPTSASLSDAEDNLDGEMVGANGNATSHQRSHLESSRQNLARLSGQMSPNSQLGDGESSMGGLHSPSSSMNDTNHNDNHQHHHQQQQDDPMSIDNYENDSNRGDEDDAMNGLNEDEDEDDDEFMSAAQMMRHQQQQRQQQLQQNHQQQQRQQQQQQQQQQLASAAAAAGLFDGDASILLSLIAANQQAAASNVGANNLLGADLHQRNMLEALNTAMRNAVQNVNSANNLQTSGLAAAAAAAAAMGAGAGAFGGAHSDATNALNLNESSNTSLGATSNMSNGDRNNSSTSASQRDKRLRTQISPEQLDYLYQKYQVESNPSRKTLESIAQDVGLSKRVVQVWFQNTRARERRGQLRMSHVVAQQQRNSQNAASTNSAITNNNNNLSANNNNSTATTRPSTTAASLGIQGGKLQQQDHPQDLTCFFQKNYYLAN